MDARNQHEVVVITGATAGVGRATARAFAKQGAYVGLLARDADRLEATRSEVDALGGKGLAISTDVADAAAVERAADQVEEKLGEIDIWVNAAMTTILSPFDQIQADEYKRATEVTYLGNVYGAMAALKHMLPRDRGRIIQVSSALAYHSVPLQSPYCGAKHAINGYTESLRAELMHRNSNVRITTVDMPGLNTPQFDWALNRMPKRPRPVAPVYQPEVAARAIVWAAHHSRQRLYVGLSSLLMIWADKFAPGLLDRYMAKSAVSGQLTSQDADPDKPDNLWQPVAGDHGARGRFSNESHEHSVQFWATTHRGWLTMVGTAVAVGAVCATTGRKKRKRRVKYLQHLID
ncbi:SDR family oxidoreductase [Dyella sp.]|uniref:SDR family oxidoreductase n=1 Tax=Dyella sp. TaxID=1869338 RepID=UPI002D771F69|nr:SDR family oxidoreductase [Dyella sp.]HET7333112.1 SDR family oxidoreductase [Dyella sp.]HET7371030.1 SDR family oxidoreductase [Gammaproteobacteria bacterium]